MEYLSSRTVGFAFARVQVYSSVRNLTYSANGRLPFHLTFCLVWYVRLIELRGVEVELVNAGEFCSLPR